MEFYKLEDIVEVSSEHLADKSVRVSYRPILETLYYSPGAVVETQADTALVKFVRCGIKDECDVTHAAEKDANGAKTILLSPTTTQVILSDGENEKPLDIR